MTLAEILELQNRPLEEAVKIMASQGVSVNITVKNLRECDSKDFPESKT